jgi:hypothetical protein
VDRLQHAFCWRPIKSKLIWHEFITVELPTYERKTCDPSSGHLLREQRDEI